MTAKATERMIKASDALVDFWRQREADGTIDPVGRKHLCDARLSKASLIRDLSTKDQQTGPVNRAMAHSRMTERNLADKLRQRGGLTVIKSKPKQRTSSAQVIGIVTDEKLMEQFYRSVSGTRSEVLAGIKESAVIHKGQ